MQKRILLLATIFSQQSLALNHNLSINAELLYWTMSEVGTDNWAQVISKPNQNQSIDILGLNFKWRPGLRVGLNYLSDSQLWDTNLFYTWYQTQANQSVRSTTDEIHSAFSGNFYANNTLGNGLSGPYYRQATIDWSFLYNTVDWQIGRHFKDNAYQLHPFVGIKAAFLNQDINTAWQTPYDNISKLPISSFSKATENIENNFWGLGPSFGLNAQWNLVNINQNNFGLFGDFSAAFLWGGWHISDVYQNDTPVSITTINNLRSSTITTTRGLVGLAWQQSTLNTYFTVELAYEAQAWMNQLKFYSFDGGRQNGTLYIQGGVLNVCMHF